LLAKKGVQLEERDLGGQPLSQAELDALIGDRDYREFLNPRNELYRERGMKDKPPARAEALRLMAENPNLIRRPILVVGKTILMGFDEKTWKEHVA
jgi:arsenate reductase-like glutaredoxin family protein